MKLSAVGYCILIDSMCEFSLGHTKQHGLPKCEAGICSQGRARIDVILDDIQLMREVENDIEPS